MDRSVARSDRNAFARWMDDNDLSGASAAKLLKISVNTVYALRARQFAPGRRLAILIEDVSNGMVTTRSWDQQPTAVQ